MSKAFLKIEFHSEGKSSCKHQHRIPCQDQTSEFIRSCIKVCNSFGSYRRFFEAALPTQCSDLLSQVTVIIEWSVVTGESSVVLINFPRSCLEIIFNRSLRLKIAI